MPPRRTEVERRLAATKPVAGRVSPATVRSVVRAAGATEAEVHAVLRNSGVSVEVPPRLPRVPDVVDATGVQDALRVLQRRHVAEFLLDGRSEPFQVVDGLCYVAGSFRVKPFGQAELNSLRAKWRSERDTTKQAAALWLLDTLDSLLASDEMGLRHLALAQLTELLRERLSAGVSLEDLPSEAAALGVAPKEAGYLAFAVVESNSATRRLYDEVSDALRLGRLREAHGRLAKLPRDVEDPDLLELTQRVGTVITTARARIREGRALEEAGDLEEAARAYLAAAEHVSDHPKLFEALARCGPASPTSLHAAPSGHSVELSWPASSSWAGKIDYRVVCGVRAAPSSAEEGRAVVETDEVSANHAAAPIGCELWYAVFARRSRNWWSDTGARAGPVVLTPGVTGLRSKMRNCEVQIRWDPPQSGRVVVSRTEGATPGSPDSGVPLSAEQPGRLRDVGLTPGVTYHYRFVTLFELASGQLLESPEQVLTIKADLDPVPVNDLTVMVDRERSMAILRWGEGANGSVQFMEAASRPTMAAGVLLSTNSLGRLEGSLHTAPRSTFSMEIPLVAGRRFLTPVTIRGERAAIGTSRVVATQAPVSGLSLRRFRGEIRALWEWPAHCTEVNVLTRPGVVPAAGDPEATKLVIARSTYEIQGGCRLPLPNGTHGVSIAAVGNVDGEAILSPPVTALVEPLGSNASVRYELRKKCGFGRARRIVRLETDDPVPPIDFVLLARPGTTRPLEASDPLCAEVLRLDDLEVTPEAPVEREVDLRHLRRPYYLRGFVVGQAAGAVDVRDPYREQLAVG